MKVFLVFCIIEDKALHKAVRAFETKADIQHSKIIHLEDSMVMYVIYNAETLEKLIHTVHHIHNITTPNEKLFGELNSAYLWYVNRYGIQQYAINLLLYLRTAREKYIKMYTDFIMWLCMYAKVIRILAKGNLPICLVTPLKLQEIIDGVKTAIRKTKPDYDKVIMRLHFSMIWS